MHIPINYKLTTLISGKKVADEEKANFFLDFGVDKKLINLFLSSTNFTKQPKTITMFPYIIPLGEKFEI